MEAYMVNVTIKEADKVFIKYFTNFTLIGKKRHAVRDGMRSKKDLILRNQSST
jgi:hypothetical protein